MYEQIVETLGVVPFADHLLVCGKKRFVISHQVGEFGFAIRFQRGIAVGGGSNHAMSDLDVLLLFGMFQHLAEDHQVYGVLQEARREGFRHAQFDVFEHVSEVVEPDATLQEP